MAFLRTPVALGAALLVAAASAAREAHAQAGGIDTTAVRCEALSRSLGVDPAARGSAGAGTPSVVLRATVRARTLRFATQPQVDVLAAGCPGVDSVRVIERRNLPDPIVAGVTYRDVSIVVEIFAHLAAMCPPRSDAASTRSGDAVCQLPSAVDSAAAAARARPPR